MGIGQDWFGLTAPFDAQYRLVTSGFLEPFWLFLIRLIFAVYTLTTNIVYLVFFLNVKGSPLYQYYVYFTHLTYIGLTAYFWASCLHTGFFTLNLRRLRRGDTSQGLSYPLQKWGEFLQVMHIYLYCTAVTFSPIVTAVYWAILKEADDFDSPLNYWNNISFHALNTGFMVIELAISCVPMPWGYLPLCLITLALYMGLAYLVHGITDWYVYNFFNPAKGTARLAMYVGGIGIAGIVVFLIMWAVTRLKDRVFQQGRGVRVITLPNRQSEKMQTIRV